MRRCVVACWSGARLVSICVRDRFLLCFFLFCSSGFREGRVLVAVFRHFRFPWDVVPADCGDERCLRRFCEIGAAIVCLLGFVLLPHVVVREF